MFKNKSDVFGVNVMNWLFKKEWKSNTIEKNHVRLVLVIVLQSLATVLLVTIQWPLIS
jgi:hypothetical protein